MKQIERQLLYLITIAQQASTRDLITIMNALGVTESYVRINLANLKKADYIVQPKRGWYQGSDMALAYIQELEDKFARQQQISQTATEYTIVTAQFADDDRKRRNRFRHYLNKMGFGQLQNGVSIAPYDQLAEVQATVTTYHLENQVQVFVTDNMYPEITSDRAQQIWNLASVNQEMATIAAWHEATLMPQVAAAHTNLDRLVCYLKLIDAVSEVYVLDPMLPQALLNSDWLGYKTLVALVKTGITLVAEVDLQAEFAQFFDQSIQKYRK